MRTYVLLCIAVLVVMPVVALLVLVVEAMIAANGEYITEVDFEVEFRTAGCEPPLRMAVLGDSTVAGLGASSERASLPGQIAMKVAESTARSVSVVGLGVSGATTIDVLREQLPKVPAGAFDVIVIEVGSNDVTRRTRLGPLERQTRSLLQQAQRRAPVVVLGSAGRLNSPNFPQPLRQVVMARATSVRARQIDVAEEVGIPIVDVAREVSPTYDRTPGANSRDRFHPSDVGYEIWARPLAQRVVESLRPPNNICAPDG